ncbi:Golgi CORVET complex core vacuolar protein 8-domain-containing protein [Lentinula edodes]|uniref:Golgi CORVET complex core vacuolar protein 8-domain-containing protein n=1 Tax=Lentinula edodes TaxID=5353 RepID=UPI001E8D6312|nr:Golgi CORVET complex core vacuolar protein 8-domain-containing protein [Lentinula edodes]KAH7874770.1 Golgi CORVET complex core vacuolar protein 8-domain-containing protein [Lentinula edodes]
MSSEFQYPNGAGSLPREDSLNLSGSEDDNDHGGDYSTRMEELFADDVQDSNGHLEDESDDDGGFLYTGNDADLSTSYRDQLRNVLEDDSDAEVHEVEKSLMAEDPTEEVPSEDEEHDPLEVLSDQTHSTPITTPPRLTSPPPADTPSKLAKPFLHPTVSRLRSYTPQSSRVPSNSSLGTNALHAASPAPSHFSSMSRMSSVSNFHSPSSAGFSDSAAPNGLPKVSDRDVFKWTELRNISNYIYSAYSSKASSVLGTALGTPTVLSANGLICVGTDDGKICVYDFRQTLKCICYNPHAGQPVGAVTALALSHDHTYVASGHSSGYIQLFDLKVPQTPARIVAPTTLSVVASGRKEGHIQGSRIISIGFVAGRHTALVSADDHGLAFYHSLGKVLFVEAPDILRILGKYPLDGPLAPDPSSPQPESPSTPVGGRKRSRYTILAMMPLPLGTTSHPTDTYQAVALLTPHKLVVVGLKPTPKTWFKFARDDTKSQTRVRSRGTLCWFPSILPNTNKDGGLPPVTEEPTTPLLACSWGRVMHILRVFESRSRQLVRNPKTGKSIEHEVGSITYLNAGKWTADEDILAIQWLNVNQAIVVSASALQVYDLSRTKVIEQISFDGLSLMSPSLRLTVSGATSYSESVGDVAHSIRVYKGKIFILGREQVRVGTLLTWADKILSFVQQGDFLSAIDLTRSYYTGEAPGNTNGLPDDPRLRKEVIGKKICELMTASANYAFSEDRMTDGTHDGPDGRGVDRTSLFEGLVSTCARACIALDDFDFLFEDLFQLYDDHSISQIFLTQLETFILNNEIHFVPPRITQRLVAMHDNNSRPDLVERIIWHIDAECLDSNQAVQICQAHHLYDALIYVYTRALRDYVAPVVELLGLIRKVNQYRRHIAEYTESSMSDMEPVILNAYKIYPYLANILSGLTYPSEQPLGEEEALQAKRDVYTFLFFGRSSVWPEGGGGKLVLTADEEGGLEPTYPYVQQLLRYDAESFLHSLDIAFEDAYLNEKSPAVDRLVVVRILMDIVATGSLTQTDKTFVHIFIARNIPKYPQFLQEAIPFSTLHKILVSLAEDPDPDTREDRQLAAEYLLSAYNPHNVPHMTELFRKAGFFRILRGWHRQDKQWGPLLLTFLQDPTLPSFEMFQDLDEVLHSSTRSSSNTLPQELVVIIQDALPSLIRKSPSNTALLIDKHIPSLHDQAIDSLAESSDEDRFMYLHCLLGPPEEEEYAHAHHPSRNLSLPLRQLYITLQCRFHPENVIPIMQYLPPDILDWDHAITTCETNKVFDAAIWALNRQGKPLEALAKADAFDQSLSLELINIFQAAPDQVSIADVGSTLRSLESIGRTGISMCIEQSQDPSAMDIPLEDIWFKLLHSQINCVQTITGSSSPEALAADIHTSFTSAIVQSEWRALSTLRSLVQETFSALVSVTTTRAVSFPRLFNRLVNAATHSQVTTGTQYTEFRSILTGMLESYRSDGDMLIITKHLLDRDLFETLEDATRERVRGWTPSRITDCSICRKPLLKRSKGQPDTGGVSLDQRIVVSRTGSIYHNRCSSS